MCNERLVHMLPKFRQLPFTEYRMPRLMTCMEHQAMQVWWKFFKRSSGPKLCMCKRANKIACIIIDISNHVIFWRICPLSRTQIGNMLRHSCGGTLVHENLPGCWDLSWASPSVEIGPKCTDAAKGDSFPRCCSIDIRRIDTPGSKSKQACFFLLAMSSWTQIHACGATSRLEVQLRWISSLWFSDQLGPGTYHWNFLHEGHMRGSDLPTICSGSILFGPWFCSAFYACTAALRQSTLKATLMRVKSAAGKLDSLEIFLMLFGQADELVGECGTHLRRDPME